MAEPLSAPLATEHEDHEELTVYKGRSFFSPRSASGSEVREVELAQLNGSAEAPPHWCGAGMDPASDGLLENDLAQRGAAPPSNGSARDVFIDRQSTTGSSAPPWQWNLPSHPSRESLSIDRSLSESIRVAGCYIQSFDDGLYEQLRAKHGIPDDFLESSLNMDTHQMATESKGGSPLYITDDDRYVVKELSRADHRMLEKLTRPYVERLLDGATLLCPIYLHFRLRTHQERSRMERVRNSTIDGLAASTSSGRAYEPSMAHRNQRHDRFYIAMRNLMPAGKPWAARYDLKGCDDDKTLEKDGDRICAVHKRFWRFWMWCRCCWSDKRWHYYEGKRRARSLRIELPPSHCDEIVRMIAGDAAWLADHGLMDYSLLLGVREMQMQDGNNVSSFLRLSSPAGKQTPWQNGRRRGSVTEYVCCDELEVTVICLGIIDFLQPWDCQKRLAALIKALEPARATVPPAAYGARFAKHFASFFVPTERLERQPDLNPSNGAASAPASAADTV